MKFAHFWLLLACSCGATTEPALPEPALIHQVSSLAQADASLTQALQRRGAFVARSGGFETIPNVPADAAFVRFEPNRGFELSLSRRNRAIATLGTESGLTLDDGMLTSTASGGVRSMWLQTGDTLEQLLLSETGSALELDWRLELATPIVSVRREDSGALLLTDEDDRGVLRVPVPFALDAAGARLEGKLAYELHRTSKLSIDLRFSLPSTAHPPLLVDPALSVVLWQKRPTEQRPLARAQSALVYHPGLRAIVVHGGSNEETFDPEVLADTWAYDGEWTQLEPLDDTAPRYGHGLAYSASPPSLLLFGGRDENLQLSGSTYRWAAGSWTEVATTGPSKRDDVAMTYVPGLTDGDVVLFAGSTNSSWEDDTWIWNGTAWAPKANAGGQGAFGASMVFDTARGRALVFGGARSVAIHLSSLGLFDGARWVDTPDPKAPTRAYAAMAFDSDRKRAVLFGGEDSEANFKAETWEWDSASAKWSERQTDVAPPALIYGSMAYDPERKRSVLFGGWVDGFSGFPDTWEYRVLGGSCETDADCDGLPCVDGACCKQPECGTCEACSTATGECESVTSEPDPDSCTDAHSCDARGACKLIAAERCRNDAECASGACADGVCCDRACKGACEACDVAGTVGACSYVTGAPRHGECDADAGCGGECEGDASSCAVAEAGVACSSSCRDGMLTLGSCDGAGKCDEAPSAACPRGLACETNAVCREICEIDADCQDGLGCRDGECVPSAVYCRERSTLHELDGTERACAPFACVSGACLETCESAQQCADGFVCDENDQCIPPPTTSRTSDGCGCRVAGGSPRGRASLLLLSLLFVRRVQKRVATPKRGSRAKKALPVSAESLK